MRDGNASHAKSQQSSQPAPCVTHITPPYKGCVCDDVSCDVMEIK
jgi:hypothetical protein